MERRATRSELGAVVAIAAGGFALSAAVGIAVAVLFDAGQAGSWTALGLMFGVLAHLRSSPRGRRVARTPLSSFFR